MPTSLYYIPTLNNCSGCNQKASIYSIRSTRFGLNRKWIHFIMITVRVCVCVWWWWCVWEYTFVGQEQVNSKFEWVENVWMHFIGSLYGCERCGMYVWGLRLILCEIGECHDPMQCAWKAQVMNIQFTATDTTHSIPHLLHSAEHMTWNCKQWPWTWL